MQNTIKIQSGNYIFKEGDNTKSVFKILSGNVMILKDSKIITSVGPGSTIGDKRDNYGNLTHSAKANSNVELLSLEDDSFYKKSNLVNTSSNSNGSFLFFSMKDRETSNKAFLEFSKLSNEGRFSFWEECSSFLGYSSVDDLKKDIDAKTPDRDRAFKERLSEKYGMAYRDVRDTLKNCLKEENRFPVKEIEKDIFSSPEETPEKKKKVLDDRDIENEIQRNKEKELENQKKEQQNETFKNALKESQAQIENSQKNIEMQHIEVSATKIGQTSAVENKIKSTLLHNSSTIQSQAEKFITTDKVVKNKINNDFANKNVLSKIKEKTLNETDKAKNASEQTVQSYEDFNKYQGKAKELITENTGSSDKKMGLDAAGSAYSKIEFEKKSTSAELVGAKTRQAQIQKQRSSEKSMAKTQGKEKNKGREH